MAELLIKFGVDEVSYPDGNVELSFSSIGLDVTAALTSTMTFTPISYLWELIDVPDGSVTALQDADAEIASFTPDVCGTYLVRLTINAGTGYERRATAYISYTTPGIGIRIPAAGETTQSGARGWAKAIGLALRLITSNLYTVITNFGSFTALVGAAGGLCPLDSNRKIPPQFLSAIIASNYYEVASEAAMLALTTRSGDMVRRTDQSVTYISKTNTNPKTMSDYGVWGDALTVAFFLEIERATSAEADLSASIKALTANSIGAAPATHASQHGAEGADKITPAAIGAIATAARGAINGVSSLGSDGKIPMGELKTDVAGGVPTLDASNRISYSQLPVVIGATYILVDGTNGSDLAPTVAGYKTLAAALDDNTGPNARFILKNEIVETSYASRASGRAITIAANQHLHVTKGSTLTLGEYTTLNFGGSGISIETEGMWRINLASPFYTYACIRAAKVAPDLRLASILLNASSELKFGSTESEFCYFAGTTDFTIGSIFLNISCKCTNNGSPFTTLIGLVFDGGKGLTAQKITVLLNLSANSANITTVIAMVSTVVNAKIDHLAIRKLASVQTITNKYAYQISNSSANSFVVTYPAVTNPVISVSGNTGNDIVAMTFTDGQG